MPRPLGHVIPVILIEMTALWAMHSFRIGYIAALMSKDVTPYYSSGVIRRTIQSQLHTLCFTCSFIALAPVNAY